MRRLFGIVVAAVAFALVAPVAALAQDATPEAAAPLDGLGLPELRLTATDDGIDLPSEVAAGRYLVVLENRSSAPIDLTFVLPPAGVTPEQLQATPPAEESGVPSWFYEAGLAGGVSASPGGTDRVVLDLEAGAWIVWASLESATDEGATPAAEAEQEELFSSLTVSDGGTPAAAAEPATYVRVMLEDHAFLIPTDLPTGPQVWQVTNNGQQPHHIVLLEVPDPITEAQVIELLELEFGMRGEDATPTAGMPEWAMDDSAIEDAGYAQVLSAGRTEWVAFDLTPGIYIAICFIPDRETGLPHALMGMVAVFSVAERPAPEDGTPAA